jgi:hypothetical protein
VTTDTVPSFSECRLVNATQCTITVAWDLNINTTAIIVEGQNGPSTKNASEDFTTPMVFMETAHDKEIPILIHSLFFICMSGNKCNDEMSLKRILHSLVIEEKFVQELSSLIKVVSPFNAKSAACFEFNNSTGNCPPNDLENCQRCDISADKWFSSGEEFCATCPHFSSNSNLIMYTTTFILNNRIQLANHALLDCQLKGCNSINNINRIYKASKITFDFGEFFKNSSNDII